MKAIDLGCVVIGDVEKYRRYFGYVVTIERSCTLAKRCHPTEHNTKKTATTPEYENFDRVNFIQT